MNKIDECLNRINNNIETPFVTAQFGNNWKSNAKKHYNIDDIIEIAWKQGRKAILLERELRKLLN